MVTLPFADIVSHLWKKVNRQVLTFAQRSVAQAENVCLPHITRKEKTEPESSVSYVVKLVGRVRQQCAEPCSLDGLGELTLMIGAGAGNSAGQDLGTLGHALAELSGVLIINGLCSVNAEHANLLAGSLGGSVIGSFHDNSPFSKFCLERHAVARENILEVAHIADGDRLIVGLVVSGSLGSFVSVLRLGLAGLVAALIAAILLCAFTSEGYLIYIDLSHIVLGTVFIVIGAGAEIALNGYQSAL